MIWLVFTYGFDDSYNYSDGGLSVPFGEKHW